MLSLFNLYAAQIAGAAESQYNCRVCASHWTNSRRLNSGLLSHFECHMKSQLVDEFSTKAVCYCHGDPCVPGSICHYMAWIVLVSGNSKMRLRPVGDRFNLNGSQRSLKRFLTSYILTLSCYRNLGWFQKPLHPSFSHTRTCYYLHEKALETEGNFRLLNGRIHRMRSTILIGAFYIPLIFEIK